MNRAITFFGQIFQPFMKNSSLRAPTRQSCLAQRVTTNVTSRRTLLTCLLLTRKRVGNTAGRLLLAGFSIIQSRMKALIPGVNFSHPVTRCLKTRSRSPLLTGSRLIFLPLATQMFQFAKFEKSKERRLATELGYGFPIGDPWITDTLSPHGLSPRKASFLLNARASIQCILFVSQNES
jgi:hypothetical protein